MGSGSGRVFAKTWTRPYNLLGQVKSNPLGLSRAGYPQVGYKLPFLVNRPNEKDQINMIIKKLLPAYNSRLLSSLISSFGELCDCGTRIENAINNGRLEKGENKPLIKKTYGGGVTTSKVPNHVNVSATLPQQSLAYPSFTKKAR